MENYGPYIDPFTLSFPEDSLVLVTGPNGIGKTIGLDAISFTFYGMTSKGERGDDVVNNEIDRNCHTWVDFEEESGDSFRVDRYHKHSKNRNTVHITRNNEPKPYKVGHREVTKEIDRLVGDRRTFTNTLMFGQKVKDFFTDLTDTDQKAIFWKLLDLLRYGYFQKRAKDMLDEKENKYKDISNKIIISQSLIQTIEQQIEAELVKAKEYDKEKAKNIVELKKFVKDLGSAKTLANKNLKKIPEIDANELIESRASLKAQIDNVSTDAANIKKNIESEVYKKANELTQSCDKEKKKIDNGYDVKLDEIAQRQKEVQDKYNVAHEGLKDQSVEHQINSKGKESFIISLNGQIDDLKSIELEEGSTCPTCLEPITEKSFKHIEEMVLDINSKKRDKEIEIGAIDIKLKKIHSAMSKLGDENNIKISEFSKASIQLEKENDAEIKIVDDRLKEVKQQLADMANKTMRSQLASLEDKSKDMQTQLAAIETQIEEVEEQIKARQSIADDIQEFENRIKNTNDKIKQTSDEEFDTQNLEFLKTDKHKKLETIQRSEGALKVIEKDITMLKFWKEAYSPKGIPSMLIDEAIPLMNKSMKKYLDLLSNGRYIVTFDTLSQTKAGEYRDKFSVNVLDTKTQANDRRQLSGGQTRLIDIATILTLRELKTSLGDVDFNLFIFDEIFDALDDSNIGYVCNILNSLKEDRSIYVVSHRHQDQLEADEHIQLT